MRLWGVSFREVDATWTDEQFNLMWIRYAEQQERERMAVAKARARASGKVVMTDDEVAGKD